jgi:hypothetical protein
MSQSGGTYGAATHCIPVGQVPNWLTPANDSSGRAAKHYWM